MSVTRGRPSASRDVRVVAEFRREPDVQLLARAFIAAAKTMAEQKMALERGKGASVP